MRRLCSGASHRANAPTQAVRAENFPPQPCRQFPPHRKNSAALVFSTLPQADRAPVPLRIRGGNKSPASCFNGGILSPWGRVKTAPAVLVRGKLATRLEWNCSRRGLRESQHWGGATLRTNGVASSPPPKSLHDFDSPSRGEYFALFNSRFGFVPRKGRVFRCFACTVMLFGNRDARRCVPFPPNRVGAIHF